MSSWHRATREREGQNRDIESANQSGRETAYRVKYEWGKRENELGIRYRKKPIQEELVKHRKQRLRIGIDKVIKDNI